MIHDYFFSDSTPNVPARPRRREYKPRTMRQMKAKVDRDLAALNRVSLAARVCFAREKSKRLVEVVC